MNGDQSDGEKAIVVEGRWCVESLLGNGTFEKVTVVRAKGSHEDLEEKFGGRASFETVSKDELANRAGYDFHRGIFATAKRPATVEGWKGKMIPTGIYAACPELADAANLGTIVRTATALGAAGVLLQDGRGADVYSRKAIRASSGAVFRIPVLVCRDLKADIEDLKKNHHFSVVGTALRDSSLELEEAPAFEKGIILFGPENDGLSTSWLELCDETIAIPMRNGVDSLNVAASAAIVLYEYLLRNRE